MKSNFIKRIIGLAIITTTILGFGSVGANAEWRNSNGEWSYYDGNGIKQTGWLLSNGKYYYLNTDGSMATNTTVGGYKLGSDGAWIQNNTNNITNTVNNINSNNNYGIVNNGESGNISVNNYYGNDNGNTNNANNYSSNNIVLPITIPSNWAKITNTTYAINSRSPLIYQVKDTFGSKEDDIINGLQLTLIEKTDLKYESKTYNDYKADCFEYLDTTQRGIEKFYNITIFNNDKVYNFVMCGTKDNYEIDKQELENIFNTTLKF